MRETWCLLCLAVGHLALAQTVPSASERWSKPGGGEPGFTRHVQPLLGKLGCSNRNCHGSFQGRGDFRLSLFSSDPKLDINELVKEERISQDDPDGSLILLKPTLQISHKGGKRFDKVGWEHGLLRAWILGGGKFEAGKEAVALRLDIDPNQALLTVKEERQLRVLAHFSDGSAEDVTCLTQFSSNDDSIASVSEAGRVTALRAGDTAIVAVYGAAVQTIPVLVPLPDADKRTFSFPANNRIDDFIAARLRQLGIVPSDLCGDEDFLRRVSLDITGTLPTPNEVLDFLADNAPDKRARKIDELLERPAYALWWTTKLCDLTGLNAPSELGSTEFGPLMGELWRDWVHRRVRDNVGYDKIIAGIITGTSRQAGQSYDEYVQQQSDYVRTKGAADFAAQDSMPIYWFRNNLGMPEEKALAVAYAFLGVRLDCAQCHKHPFDRWTQQDFIDFASLFEKVRTGAAPDAEGPRTKLFEALGNPHKKTAAERRPFYWKLARAGQPSPWPEVYIGTPKKAGKTPDKVRLLGSVEINLAATPDPRVPLMDWMRAPDNPYFAPAFVNRVWAYYFGKGLVDPPDDHNLANPPSHRELLKHLSDEFIRRGFDMRWLHREITMSRTYQLSWQTHAQNKSDERNFSHALVRRLPAEVAVDAIIQATLPAAKLAKRAVDLKDRRIGVQAAASTRATEYGLVVFGKPLRLANCDCEREQAPSLLQAIYLRNDRDLIKLLDDGWPKEVKASDDQDELVRLAYLRTLSRLPVAAEVERSRRHLQSAASVNDGIRDLLWALLNTQEFITNH